MLCTLIFVSFDGDVETYDKSTATHIIVMNKKVGLKQL